MEEVFQFPISKNFRVAKRPCVTINVTNICALLHNKCVEHLQRCLQTKSQIQKLMLKKFYLTGPSWSCVVKRSIMLCDKEIRGNSLWCIWILGIQCIVHWLDVQSTIHIRQKWNEILKSGFKLQNILCVWHIMCHLWGPAIWIWSLAQRQTILIPDIIPKC